MLHAKETGVGYGRLALSSCAPYLFYPFLTVILGSTSILPAQSCDEIKISEGQDAVNGNWWLSNPNGTEEAILTYCDMNNIAKGIKRNLLTFILEL